MYSAAFAKGVMSVFEKRAGLLDVVTNSVNTAANLKVLADMTNNDLSNSLDDDIKKSSHKKTAKKLKMTIDPELLADLTPEQRKRLFFTVRSIKSASEKRAQAALSPEDAKALMEYVNAQKAQAAKAEQQRKAMRDKNRSERVRTAKLALMGLLGSAGAYAGGRLGGHFGGSAGGIAGALAGGIGGAVGGWYLGASKGNRDADRMEKIEDETGESVAAQATRRAATLANYNAILNSRSPFDRAVGSRVFLPYL